MYIYIHLYMYMYIHIRKFYDVSNKLICVLIVIIFQYIRYILRTYAWKKKIKIIVSIHVNVPISGGNYT